MHEWLWFLLGVLAGAALMLPLGRRWLRRAERRARDAERRARDAERLAELGSMTGGLAHEIKNPLSTIGLNAQLLAESLREADLPADQRDRLLRRLETLAREVERLGGILSDFLQFAGRIKLDPQPRDLRQVVDELSDFFHPQCDQAGVTLRTHLPQQPVMVRVDQSLFKQALLNLMINATQAMAPTVFPATQARSESTRLGELMLRVEQQGDEAVVHVIDTGPGIPPEKQGEIFRPYVSTKTGGTGLGLPTARRIVEEHGGRISVHSTPGKGSDFSIHLPCGSV
ncbi:MAG TPA: ATP-binding protein [Phycisphaerales bacterium]|nr:ATP-binding protein [Phycisphaerales bacterium]